ncbi:predicted protein [Plenodomus lingam JN3]|uniref:Predicted protein n=1 Tax=Leptosphaeria maculans (strain JN3 / isolate v23.1.3 / race Av1-4-5-6-7-8) TaxID=985895 RepID=E4ZT43_LEPMJ|nr:predicted protein [Plenodomus lingam JN3]CBX94474.1 predicted protein [Plenodomus lingam JN3]
MSILWRIAWEVMRQRLREITKAPVELKIATLLLLA